MSGRYNQPLGVRLPNEHKAAVRQLAAQHRMSVSSFIKMALRPFIDGVNGGVNEQTVIEAVSSPVTAPVSFRPVIAPANRTRTEAPVRGGSGFHERTK